MYHFDWMVILAFHFSLQIRLHIFHISRFKNILALLYYTRAAHAALTILYRRFRDIIIIMRVEFDSIRFARGATYINKRFYCHNDVTTFSASICLYTSDYHHFRLYDDGLDIRCRDFLAPGDSRKAATEFSFFRPQDD